MSDHTSAARTLVRRERRRTVDEREAFEAFLSAVSDLSADGDVPRRTAAGTRLADRRCSTGPAAVRDAYERTVMSVPHYREEYGDTFEESLRAEFGPTVAAAVTDGPGLSSHGRHALLAAAREAHTERSRFVPALDAEARSLRDGEDRLVAVLEELAELDREPLEDHDFGGLDALRARLAVLERKVDAVAADRQATLRRQRRELDLSGVPDVPTYLYQELEVSYPVLADAARVADLLTEGRRTVERSMARA